MTPDEMQTLLQAHNIGFSANDVPYGRQFRLEDGAIANVYNKGALVWQGKADTALALKVKGLCGGGPAAPASVPTSGTVVSPSNNKVFIVYGHDIECREQLELLLRRMKLEPVILQNLPIAGDTIIEKLEANIDVRYACVLLTPDDEGHPEGQPKEKKFRARQNVILELGMFVVRLGRKRAAILHKVSLELPTDISGLIYIKFNNRVDEVKDASVLNCRKQGSRSTLRTFSVDLKVQHVMAIALIYPEASVTCPGHQLVGQRPRSEVTPGNEKGIMRSIMLAAVIAAASPFCRNPH
jgi:predicted nucleotide-binding protein